MSSHTPNPQGADPLETAPLLPPEKRCFAQAHYARPPRRSATDLPVPQTIAHRGFQLRYPENTLRAFRGAIEAGTHALETDIHLSRDGVVVLSHDPSLERCFGVKKKVIDCDWEYLSTLRTTREPHEPMPRLYDLLVYLNQPALDKIWVLLDIKLDNDPTTVIANIASTISSVPPAPGTSPWHTRLVLGCWSARFFPLCASHLPLFPLTLICFDLHYARQFLSVPNVAFNLHQKILMGPLGRGFLRDARAANRLVYVWTVNEPNLMRWCIRKAVDGVITDDPALFRHVCDEYDGEAAGDGITLRQWWDVGVLSLMVFVLGWWFRRRFLERLDFVGEEGGRKRGKRILLL